MHGAAQGEARTLALCSNNLTLRLLLYLQLCLLHPLKLLHSLSSNHSAHTTSTLVHPTHTKVPAHYILWNCSSSLKPPHTTSAFLCKRFILHQTTSDSAHYIHSNHFIHSAETTFHTLHLLYTSNSHYVRLYPTLPTTSTVIHPST